MTLQQDVDVLRKIPLFAKIEPARLKLLAFTSEHVEFRSGEAICRQGDPGDAAYIVLEGSADVVVQAEGGPMTVAKIGRYDIVGEIAILCDVPRTATVVATSPLVALRVSKDGFFNLVTQFPAGRRRGDARAGLAPAADHAAPDRDVAAAARGRACRLSLPSACIRGAGRPGSAPLSTGWCARRRASLTWTTCSPSSANGLSPKACRLAAHDHAPAHPASAVSAAPGCSGGREWRKPSSA